MSRPLMARCAAAMLMGLLLAVQAPPIVRAVATTFTVTVMTDDAGSTCDDPCSLRQAINAANANPGTDTIEFRIQAALVGGVHTITPTSPLPAITQPVIIDATTDDDFVSCFDGPVIEITGSTAGAAANGLELASGAGASTVRGFTINSFGGAGVYLNASGAALRCSFLGTDASGAAARPNTFGVRLGRIGTVGGTSIGDGNLISGNATGVYVQTSDAVIQGNLIGTDATGTLTLGNANAGIRVENNARTQIGGTTTGAGNVISGNRTGIEIFGPDNIVVGNRIGTAADGVSALGNTRFGIQIGSAGNPAPTGNVVGGTMAGAGNIIAFNASSGVFVQDNLDSTVNNAILGNSIHSNGGLGIDLGGGGVNANDAGDADIGPNHLQNFPLLTSATSGAPGAIEGILDGGAGTFRIELFKSSVCDASGNGEGEIYLGTVGTTANTPFTFAAPLAPGDIVTATATDGAGNTSEFSACRTTQLGATPTFTVNTTDDADDGACTTVHCSLREAITRANAVAGVDTISFAIPGSGPHTIRPVTQLPVVTQPVVIDGTTQPGFQSCTAGPVIELDGTDAIGPGPVVAGIRISAGSSTVRGLVINRFSGDGIVLTSGGGNVVECNWIGIDRTGATGAPNGVRGLAVDTANNTIGGGSASSRNVVSAHGDAGIWLAGPGATGNLVHGNYVGTDASGTADLGNVYGIYLFAEAAGNQIGGTAPGEGNVVSGNQLGIILQDANDNAVEGNKVGLDATGSGLLGNSSHGIWILGDATNNRIGGTDPGQGNVISGNSDGVQVESSGSSVPSRNAILGNSISANNGIGIDLTPNGVTANDTDDTDLGSNGLQNFPVLTRAAGSAVWGTLDSAASTSFRIEVFRSTACDPSGFGEGQTLIGADTVTTNGSGDASFTITVASLSPGQIVTATATDPAGDTSEFSACRTATEANPPPGETTLRWCVPRGLWIDFTTQTCGGRGPQAAPYGTITTGPSGTRYAGTTGQLAFPYVWSPDETFPASGDFVLDIRLRFDAIRTHGDGVRARRWIDATPGGGNSPFVSGADRCSVFGIWADTAGGARVTFSGQRAPVAAAGSFHDYRLEYVNGRYLVFLDGQLLIGPITIGPQVQVDRYWLGNPRITDWGAAAWTEFTIAHIAVSQPGFVDTDDNGEHDGTQAWTPVRVPDNARVDTDGDGLPNHCDPVTGPPLPYGTITVAKATEPGGTGQAFSFSGALSGSLGDGDTLSADVAPGTYTVTEAAAAGWDLAAMSCDDDDSTVDLATRTATFVVAAGEDISCVFTNRQRAGRIVVVKDAIPNSEQDFSFTAAGGLDPSSFSLDDNGIEGDDLPSTFQFDGLTPGSGYSISETSHEGWTSSVTCDDGSPATNIDVGAGETVTCTFVNRVVCTDGPIVLTPLPADIRLGMLESNECMYLFEEQSRTIGAGGQPVDASPVLPGANPVLPEGSVVTSYILHFDDASNGPTVPLSGTYEFPRPVIGLIFESLTTLDGSDGSLGVPDAGDPANDPPTTGLFYEKTSTARGLEGADSYSIAPDGMTVTFNLQTQNALDNVRIIVGTLPSGRIVVVKDAVPDTGQDFGFTTGGGLDPASFSLDDDADPTLPNSRTFVVAPGSGYSLAETPLEDWDLTASCDDESPISNISVAPGETVICTFTNVQRGRIVIVKQTVPAGSTASFEFDPSWSGTNFTLSDGQSHDSGLLLPGLYSVTELAAPGWTASATCNDDSPINGIVVSPGETVTCSVTNTGTPDLRLTKTQRNVTIAALKPAQPGTTATTSPIAVQLGDVIEYVLTVRNVGTSAAVDVTVIDVVPTGLRVLGAGSCTPLAPVPAGGRLSCALGSIAPGATVSVTLTTQVVLGCAVVGTRFNDVLGEPVSGGYDDGVTDGNDRPICGGGGGDTISGQGGDDLIFGNQPLPMDASPLENRAWIDLQKDGVEGVGEPAATVEATPVASVDLGDTIHAGAGNDEVYGQDGIDTLLGGSGNDSMWGALGDDSLNGEAGADVLFGEAGADILQGGDQADRVEGGPGNDTIEGDLAAGAAQAGDVLLGQDGNDTIRGRGGADTIDGGAGSDTLYGDDGNDNLLGRDGNDVMRGGDGSDTLDSGAGADTIYGEAGNDDISGGLDGDSISGGDGRDLINGNGGNDTIQGGEHADDISGGPGADAIQGDAGDDLIDGNDGGDTLSGGAGDDRMNGGDGDDNVQGGTGTDILHGNAGDDRVDGGPSPGQYNQLYGDSGTDFCSFGPDKSPGTDYRSPSCEKPSPGTGWGSGPPPGALILPLFLGRRFWRFWRFWPSTLRA